ncbi:MAG: YjfB family protein [Burkholderiales bacterium]|nr:YjfB family protein [Burkholderiales bacterium]
MDVGGIASLATGIEQVKTAQSVSVAVLKKALEAQGSEVLSLLEALPPVTTPSNLPPHLGRNINTTA